MDKNTLLKSLNLREVVFPGGHIAVVPDYGVCEVCGALKENIIFFGIVCPNYCDIPKTEKNNYNNS